MASCCLAGLWLWFDYLTESHQISQRISSPSGSYWHGIMHRREPDYPNAKYWFDRVGEHPIFTPLANEATQMTCDSGALDVGEILSDDASWDSYCFVDLCRQHAGTSSDAEMLCRRIARLEWQLLFDYCYRNATGNQPTWIAVISHKNAGGRRTITARRERNSRASLLWPGERRGAPNCELGASEGEPAPPTNPIPVASR